MVVQNTRPKDIPEDSETVDNGQENGGGEMNGRVGQEREHSGPPSEHSDEDPEETDLIRLKELVPSVSAKDNVTQLDIILEAIRYIDSLQNRLADKLESGDLELVKLDQSEASM